MARRHKSSRSSGRTLLLVDDAPDYLEATRQLLEDEGHTVLTAENGPAALQLLRENPVDLVLLDYLMPGMTGQAVVEALRVFSPLTQVILQTGYASEHPPREMLRTLDIQGYHDKSEGPERLLLWTDVGLKAAYTVQLLDKSHRGLRYILDITPELHRLQPLEELLQGVLWQVAGLLGATHSFVAVLPAARGGAEAPGPTGFLAMVEEGDLVIKAATGHFHTQGRLADGLDPLQLELVKLALADGALHTEAETSVIPLRLGARTIGVMYLDRPALQGRDAELLELFANQAAVAICNSQLYQLATLDVLTGVGARGFFDQCLAREVRVAHRTGKPLSLLLVDMDRMKQINDGGGHLAGDEALRLIGKALRESVREADVVGRYGGDEFAILLPDTLAAAAALVAQRLQGALAGACVQTAAGPLPVGCSIGLAVLQAGTDADSEGAMPATFFATTAENLIRQADRGLYQAKSRRDGLLGYGGTAAWPCSLTTAEPLLMIA